jgi:L-arabinose isomerase
MGARDMELKSLEAWFITGSQGLYGEDALRQVAEDSSCIADEFNATLQLPVHLVCKPVVTSSESILEVFRDANASPNCIGVVCWMHTFSPAKMWIAGLNALQKPMAHLHTQFHRELPWATIDMDFMNLHQSAHGDREFGYICTRMKKARKVIVGHWQDDEVLHHLTAWMRAAAGVHEMRRLKIARFGDNMRQVAVTEGDKVEAQIQLGCEVNGYGVGDLVQKIGEIATTTWINWSIDTISNTRWPPNSAPAAFAAIRSAAKQESNWVCGRFSTPAVLKRSSTRSKT